MATSGAVARTASPSATAEGRRTAAAAQIAPNSATASRAPISSARAEPLKGEVANIVPVAPRAAQRIASAL
ncbi:MAG: hypothetical protein E6J03_01805, partial [Chloroflexi bacterium]